MTDKALSAKEAFAAAFRQAVVDHRFGTDGPLVKPVTYVAAENGLFEVRMNAIGTFARKIEGVPGRWPRASIRPCRRSPGSCSNRPSASFVP
jgi:hypothetical protein